MSRAFPVAILLFVGTGCASVSDGQKLFTARTMFVASLKTANTLIEQGVVTNQHDKDVIFAAASELRSALNDAETKFINGDKLGFGFAFSHVGSAIDRLSRLLLKHQRSAGATDAERNTSWESRKSRRSSSSSLASSAPSPTYSTDWRRVRSLPRRTSNC